MLYVNHLDLLLFDLTPTPASQRHLLIWKRQMHYYWLNKNKMKWPVLNYTCNFKNAANELDFSTLVTDRMTSEAGHYVVLCVINAITTSEFRATIRQQLIGVFVACDCVKEADASTMMLLTSKFANASTLCKQAWSNWNFNAMWRWPQFAVGYFFGNLTQGHKITALRIAIAMTLKAQPGQSISFNNVAYPLGALIAIVSNADKVSLFFRKPMRFPISE